MQNIVYYIQGDGIGPEVWRAARPVLDAAVSKAYGSARSIKWQELLAGERALEETGSLLPEATIAALRQAQYAIKGPLNTPVGKGFRSLNVTLRQTLDLFACIRPIRYFKGIVSPVKHPEKVDMVIFRENTEDVYAGIEYESNSVEANKLLEFLRDELKAPLQDGVALGIKPMTEKGCKRLVRKAMEFALAQGRPSLTLVHKGNIMKFTEGAFRQWGYDLAAAEFAAQVVTETALAGADAGGKLILKDRIADAMFQEALMHPEQYSVLATTNLNGDYLSDALAAQVGGLGLAPGVNMSNDLAFFEATHGTAPAIAGQDKANPGSVILSGALMLEHMGWQEAAQRIYIAMESTIAKRTVTVDLASQMEQATTVGCVAFGELLGQAL